MTHSHFAARLAASGLLLALVSAPAWAQVKGTKGKIMTREELRACLQQEDAVKALRSDFEAQNAQLGRDKDELQRLGETLKAEGAAIAQRNAAIRELGERSKAHQVRVADWNGRAAKMQEADPAEQKKLHAQLEAEKDTLQKAFEAMKAENAQLTEGFNERVARYNEQAREHGQRVQALNERALQLNEQAGAEQRQREAWRVACADRRYREDDEIAIRRGK